MLRQAQHEDALCLVSSCKISFILSLSKDERPRRRPATT